MRWQDIEIQDWDDKSYVGDKAKNFVMSNRPEAPVHTYLDDRISVTFHGKRSVSVADVSKVLKVALLGKVKKLIITGFPDISKKDYVPRRTATNVINEVPKYTVTFELGDIDALFEAINDRTEPWKDKGVQQRLQVLGYLYTPLEHPGNKAPDFHHAKACWHYYKTFVHKIADNSAAIDKLQEEIYGNLLAASFPKSGVVLSKSVLPEPGQFAAIRFPGGYCNNKSAATERHAGDHVFNNSALSALEGKYVFELGGPRHKIEKAVFDDNTLIGKFPLIAKVTAKWANGKTEIMPDVPVIFQLEMPDNLPPGSAFAAPELPDKVMNYSLAGSYWASEEYPDHTKSFARNLTPEEWLGVHRLTHAAAKAVMPLNQGESLEQKAKALADRWIDIWTTVDMKYEGMENWWGSDDKKPEKLTLPLDKMNSKLGLVLSSKPPSKPIAVRDAGTWNGFLKLSERAKAKSPGDLQAARATANSWIDVWSQDDTEIKEWNDDAAVPTRPKAAVITELKSKLDAALGIPPTSDPSTMGTKLTKSQWDSLQLLAQNARETHPGNIVEAETLAKKWIKEWVEASEFGWPNVSEWWGDKSNTPYPRLDSARVSNARDVVDALLADKNVITTPEKSGVGQRKFIADLMAQIESGAAVDDPQKRNAPKAEYGGKSGAPIDEIFDKREEAIPGFHYPRPGEKSDYGILKFATLPADTGKDPHAMQCLTNDKGFAGVIFKPSHCGGDTYKLRAYIDPDWLAKRAPGVAHKSVVEKGTMVVWRNIRLFRYFQLRRHYENLSKMSTELSALLKQGGCDYDGAMKDTFDLMYLTTPLTNLAVVPGDSAAPTGTNPEGKYPPFQIDYLKRYFGTENEHMLKFRPLPVDFSSIESQLNRAYCEWISDCPGPEAISNDRLRDAIAAGTKAFDLSGKKIFQIEWDRLFLRDDTSPFFVNIRGWKNYVASLPLTERQKLAGIETKETTKWGDMFVYGFYFFWDAVLEYFAEGGVYPGLTFVQFPRGDTWDTFCGLDRQTDSSVTSGYSAACRSLIVSFTDGKYKSSFLYPATSNCLHELGHVLGIAHQEVGPGANDEQHQKAVLKAFSNPADDECVCVMSYTGCYGDLCGRCLISLRGWRTHG